MEKAPQYTMAVEKPLGSRYKASHTPENQGEGGGERGGKRAGGREAGREEGKKGREARERKEQGVTRLVTSDTAANIAARASIKL